MKAKKLLSAMLSAVMLTGCLTVAANAAETVDEPSGSTSYRDEFIAALLEQEDKWFNHVDNWTELGFTDLNFDGNLEFVVYPTFAAEQTPPSYVYSCVDGQVEELFHDTYNISDNISYDFDGNEGLPSIYYDKEAKKYRTFTVTRFTAPEDGFTEPIINKNYVLEIFYNEQYKSELFLGSSYLMDYSGYNQRDQKYFVYDENKVEKQVTKEEYDKADRRNGLIDCHVKRKCLQGGEKYQNSNKKETLEMLYDSFTYDKYDDTDTGVSVFAGKSVAEVIKVIGDNFKYGTTVSGDYYIYNDSVFPNVIFVLNTMGDTEEVFKRKALEGKYTVTVIGVAGGTQQRIDNLITADMDYIDCCENLKKYYDCKGRCSSPKAHGQADAVGFDYIAENGSTVTIAFEISSEMLSEVLTEGKTITAGEMKALNPHIKGIEIKANTENPTPDIEIKGFELEYGIGCGESKVMEVSIDNGSKDNLEFKSSNEKVANITKDKDSNPVVKGVSGGTATLTATDTVSGSTATCEVKVYNDTKFNCSYDTFNFRHSPDSFFAGEDLAELNKARGAAKDDKFDFLDVYYATGIFNSKINYKLSDNAFNRLLGHAVNSSEKQNIINQQKKVWGGSCFGMSNVTEILYVKRYGLPLSRVFLNEPIGDISDPEQKNNISVSELPKPVNSYNMENLINYYQLTQYFYFYDNIELKQAKEIKNNYSEALNKLVDSINDTSTPVSVGIHVAEKDNNGNITYKSGHQILLLRVKSETEDYYEIECYDINQVNKYSYLKLYKTVGNLKNDSFKIKYNNYNVMSSYLEDINDVDHLNYLSETTEDSEILINDKISIWGKNNFAISANDKTLIENGKVANDSVLGPVPTNVGAVADSEFDSVSDMTYYVDKGLSDVYTVQCKDNDHYGQTEITLDDHMFSLTAKNSGTATFDDETGAVNVSMDKESDYKVSVTDNENICGWDWFTMSISADDSKSLDVQFTDDGVLINGDNLKGTEITVNNVYDDSTLTIDETLTNVMITKSGDEITATEVKQNGSTNTNTSNGTAGKSTASTAAKVSADGVTTGDVTKISVILLVLAISGVVLAVSLKRRRSN